MWTRLAQVCALGLVSVGQAEAADGADPALAREFEIAAGLAAEVFAVDPVLSDLLLFEPLSLPPLAQEYEVVDLEDYTDPTSATIHLTTGALLLRDPSETGTLARFRFQDADGNWIRDSEGRYYTATWYELDDGRLAKLIRNADGDGVGTYTIDPIAGGYELALDLDADRVIDVHDALTSDGHEQISATAFGREWIELFGAGYNALCYPAVEGGLAGMP
ncbi:MAG: hypothetical protein ABMB14_29965, partial [Myxococcota bacterium]